MSASGIVKRKLTGFIVGLILLSSLPASAKTIKVVIGLSLPPYIIQASTSGMEFDIVREALLSQGLDMVPTFVNLKSIPAVFKNRKVDAAMTVNERFGLSAYLSDVVIQYQNYAITLAKNNFHIKTVDDLAGKSVVAFQNAKIYLGDDFAVAVKKAASYNEIDRQLLQVNQLFLGRVDVVISDKNIFLFYRPKANKRVDINQKVIFHPIFAPNPYRVAFHDQEIRDRFNQGLRQLRESGRYQKIKEAYVPMLNHLQ